MTIKCFFSLSNTGQFKMYHKKQIYEVKMWRYHVHTLLHSPM